VLTLVTGLVDAFSYLVLGHVFVANMTGNVVFLAFSLAGAPGFSVSASLTALAAFAVGALVGGRIAHRYVGHRGRVLFATVIVEVVLVGAATTVAWVHGEPYVDASQYILIVLMGSAMGAQNASARSLAVPDLTTTVLTLTVTGISADSKLAGGPDSRIGRRLVSAGAMFLGAVIGAVVVLRGFGAGSLLIATAVLACAGVGAWFLARSNAPWVAPAGKR